MAKAKSARCSKCGIPFEVRPEEKPCMTRAGIVCEQCAEESLPPTIGPIKPKAYRPQGSNK